MEQIKINDKNKKFRMGMSADEFNEMFPNTTLKGKYYLKLQEENRLWRISSARKELVAVLCYSLFIIVLCIGITLYKLLI